MEKFLSSIFYDKRNLDLEFIEKYGNDNLYFPRYFHFIDNIKYFFKNLKLFKKHIFKYRWYDYGFDALLFEDLIRYKIKGFENTSAVYEGMENDIKIMKEMLKNLENFNQNDDEKYLIKFFDLCKKHYCKFWN